MRSGREALTRWLRLGLDGGDIWRLGVVLSQGLVVKAQVSGATDDPTRHGSATVDT